MTELGADAKEMRREIERARREYERWMSGGQGESTTGADDARSVITTLQGGFFG